MKNMTIYTVTTFIIASVFYTNMGLAMQADSSTQRLSSLQVTSIFSLEAGDDDREEENDNDQCELIFPLCEAHRV